MHILEFIESGVRILEGWTKYFIDYIRHKENDTTKFRYMVCSNCEHNVKGVCNLCHCVIKAKVRC